VGARQQAHAQNIHVFLNGDGYDFIGSTVQSGVDHIHAGIAQGSRHDLDAAVVPVKAYFGEQYPDWRRHGFPIKLTEYGNPNSFARVALKRERLLTDCAGGRSHAGRQDYTSRDGASR
jgi:hypothetical protein